jgi:Domain of unknown function (DUF5679)
VSQRSRHARVELRASKRYVVAMQYESLPHVADLPVDNAARGPAAVSGLRTDIEQGEVMAETYSGEFYCVKCKAKREASGEVHVNDKGTRMAKAKCPVCGTNLNRILGRA